MKKNIRTNKGYKYYFVACAEKDENETIASYIFPLASCKEEAMDMAREVMGLYGTGQEELMVGDTFKPEDLHPVVHRQLHRINDFDGFIQRGNIINFGDRDIETALNLSCREWNTKILFIPNNNSKGEKTMYPNVEISNKRCRKQYCVFAMYGDDNQYKTLFPFAEDEVKATLKARKYLKKIGLPISKTKCVGPINIFDLPYAVLAYELEEVSDFDGFIQKDQYGLYYSNIDNEDLTPKDMLRDLATDWINAVDL